MKDYRNKFPFRIGTTSYILQNAQGDDSLTSNVKYLMESFDKIQLLFFGKDYIDDLATPDVIDRLLLMKETRTINYTVHLPIDLYLLDSDKADLDRSISLIGKIMDMTEKLDIGEYILHIDHAAGTASQTPDYEKFGMILEGLSRRFGPSTSYIYIENTQNDLGLYKDIIMKSRHPVCMDSGHLYMRGFDAGAFISNFDERILEVHLHGCSGSKDHISLAESDGEYLAMLPEYIKSYKHSVIIEVFSEKDLAGSMEYLEKIL